MSSLDLLQRDVIDTRKRVSVMARETLSVQMVGNAIVKYTSRPPKGVWQKVLSLIGIQARFDLREFEAFLKIEEKAVQDAVSQAQSQARVQVIKGAPVGLVLPK